MEENKVSACLVVYNEERVIERCLESIKNLADEIIIVHDGECTDTTLEIAKKFTDKIFVRPHIGIAEPHRSFTYEQAVHDWILQIDADEYFEGEDVNKIKGLIEADEVDGYNFKWELFNGKRVVTFLGLQKLCLFRKSKITYQGLPQTAVTIKGRVGKVDITLHHRPLNDNTSWVAADKKRKYWLKAHVKYFFPELVTYMCFNTDAGSWIAYTRRVRRHPLSYLLFYPLKNFVGQVKNGLWTSWLGFNIALQQYVYYLFLYWQVWKMHQKLKSR